MWFILAFLLRLWNYTQEFEVNDDTWAGYCFFLGITGALVIVYSLSGDGVAVERVYDNEAIANLSRELEAAQKAMLKLQNENEKYRETNAFLRKHPTQQIEYRIDNFGQEYMPTVDEVNAAKLVKQYQALNDDLASQLQYKTENLKWLSEERKKDEQRLKAALIENEETINGFRNERKEWAAMAYCHEVPSDKAEMEMLRGELRSEKDAHAATKTNLFNKKAECNNFENDVKDLRHALKTLQDELASQVCYASTSTQELEMLESLREENYVLKGRLEIQINKHQTQESDHAAVKQQYDTVMSEHQECLDLVTDFYRNASSDYASFVADTAHLMKVLQHVPELYIKSLKTETLETKVNELTANLNNMEAIIDELNVNLNNMAGEATLIQANHDYLKEYLAKLNGDSHDKLRELNLVGEVDPERAIEQLLVAAVEAIADLRQEVDNKQLEIELLGEISVTVNTDGTLLPGKNDNNDNNVGDKQLISTDTANPFTFTTDTSTNSVIFPLSTDFAFTSTADTSTNSIIFSTNTDLALASNTMPAAPKSSVFTFGSEQAGEEKRKDEGLLHHLKAHARMVRKVATCGMEAHRFIKKYGLEHEAPEWDIDSADDLDADDYDHSYNCSYAEVESIGGKLSEMLHILDERVVKNNREYDNPNFPRLRAAWWKASNAYKPFLEKDLEEFQKLPYVPAIPEPATLAIVPKQTPRSKTTKSKRTYSRR